MFALLSVRIEVYGSGVGVKDLGSVWRCVRFGFEGLERRCECVWDLRLRLLVGGAEVLGV